ncbi:MAG: hypothetical protein AAGB97_05360 [Dehalococcoidia bacterium]|nr:hypothetical protein [Chloroflexota bacterium]MBT9160467.1 hypothetical protein [Chloroflexota bacterium]MBT9162944.1 hypothetical protein [Chloroflexota bacterium]
MKSQIFYTDAYTDIQSRIPNLLNSHEGFLSPSTASSTRAVGDAIQEIISSSLDSLLGDLCEEYSASFARRAMADMAFKDRDGFYYVVDVKTHRTDTRFNMPNLTSVERLSRFYEDDKNYFVILIVSYHIEGTLVSVTQARFVPIEFLQWDCLTIGALGWGQIQIANSNYINVVPQYSRKKWMLELCDLMLEFYPKEIAKIGDRIERFQKVREFWKAKPDD